MHFTIAEGFVKATTVGQMGWFFLMAVMYITGAGLYAARIPERFFPGKFDIWVSVLGGLMGCLAGSCEAEERELMVGISEMGRIRLGCRGASQHSAGSTATEKGGRQCCSESSPRAEQCGGAVPSAALPASIRLKGLSCFPAVPVTSDLPCARGGCGLCPLLWCVQPAGVSLRTRRGVHRRLSPLRAPDFSTSFLSAF